MSTPPSAVPTAETPPAETPPAETPPAGRAVIQALQSLRRSPPPRAEFWPLFAQGAAHLCRAPAALVLLRDASGTPWRTAGRHGVAAPGAPAADQSDAVESRLIGHAGRIIERALNNGFAFERLRERLPGLRQPVLLTVALEAAEGQGVLVLVLDPDAQQQVNEAVVRALLVADVPAAGAAAAGGQGQDGGALADVLDLMTMVYRKDHFLAAALTLVNTIAARFACSRVSIGWKDGDYVRVQAISHMERFERKTDAVQDLEAVFEESFDQDEEIVWPADAAAAGVITTAHQHFARNHGVDALLSLPLRTGDEVVGVVCCERLGGGFDEPTARILRLVTSQMTPWLVELRRRANPWGGRLAHGARRQLARFFGPERVLLKLIGTVTAAAVIHAALGDWTYRVEGTSRLTTDSVALLSAPYDGYVEEVQVRAGDVVAEGQPLLKLDTREMLMREAEVMAELHRFSREAEKARARNELAEMRIAEAQEEQARTQLERIRYYLEHAVIRAPFSGVVVEGDKQKLIGAPVGKGDALLHVAQLKGLYAEIRVDERDVREVAAGNTGELALLSQPERKLPFVVERILPMAQAEENVGNIFVIRAEFPDTPPSWWRPGMSGLAKIEVGERRIAWIMLHRTIDFLRMMLWW